MELTNNWFHTINLRWEIDTGYIFEDSESVPIQHRQHCNFTDESLDNYDQMLYLLPL